MKRAGLMIAALGLAALTAGPAAPAPAQSKADEAKASAEAFDEVMAANRVAVFARKYGDFNAMMTAASMMLKVPMRDPDHPGAEPTFSDGGYLDEARVMAKGDPMLLIQVNAAATDRGVGSSIFGAGLLRVIKDVDPQGAYTIPIKAKPNELLRVGAIGGSGASLGMRLRDGQGKVVCSDLGTSYSPVCSIQPGKATDYKVEVLNQGKAATRAVILSN